MSPVRLLVAAALLALAAWVGLRALLRPDPYVTLARPVPPPAAAPPAAAPPAPARPTAPPAPTSPEPAAPFRHREPPTATALHAALAALDRARAAGYADPVAADPDAWAARSCACYAVDAARLRALAAAGHALRARRAALIRIVVTRAGPASARLVVTDRLGPYAAVDARGRAVARWPASGRRTWHVTLVRVGGRWLLGGVARAP